MSGPLASVAAINAIGFGIYGNVNRRLQNPDVVQCAAIAGAASGFVQVNEFENSYPIYMYRISEYSSGNWICFFFFPFLNQVLRFLGSSPRLPGWTGTSATCGSLECLVQHSRLNGVIVWISIFFLPFWNAQSINKRLRSSKHFCHRLRARCCNPHKIH